MAKQNKGNDSVRECITKAEIIHTDTLLHLIFIICIYVCKCIHLEKYVNL